MPVINPLTGLELLQLQGQLGNFFSSYNESTFDDFAIAGLAGGQWTNHWGSSVSGTGVITLAANQAEHPGIISISTGTNISSGCKLVRQGASSVLRRPTGAWECRLMGQLPNLSDAAQPFIAYVGIFSSTSAVADIRNGYYFRYTHTDNAGNWSANTALDSVRTNVDTGVPAVAGAFPEFRINGNIGSTEISFYINNTRVAAITTNICLASEDLTGRVQMTKAGAGTTARVLLLDYHYYAYSFVTGR